MNSALTIQLETPQKDIEVYLNTMRDISEMLVWGDKHNPLIIDAFLDDDTLNTIFDIVKKGNKRALLQFLQSFAIMVENIKDTRLLCLFNKTSERRN